MPELPEVETVRRGLAPAMEGARVRKLRFGRPDLRFPFPEDFAELIEGKTIVSLGRRAKYLLIELEDGLTWLDTSGRTWTANVLDGSSARDAIVEDFNALSRERVLE